ncbi:FecR family protein [Spirosoma sp. KUDC1026]|uniref:FecR family protein n=1 Tax=Spirosoma sp. KUDC1026 TaxID=2745947 RepID=UPI00159B99F7|nr:FecR family protein [Spirosoma sp. KUDC1026]QKZ14777.1 FecR family protein [Spirosoma sp. KUDC1026]
MHDYRQYEPEELAADVSFQRWKLYEAPVEREFWENWLRENPDKQDLIDKAQSVLLSLNTLYQQPLADESLLSDDDVKTEINRLYQSLADREADRSPRWVVQRSFQSWQYGIAAGVALVLGVIGWYAFSQLDSRQAITPTYGALTKRVASPWKTISNTTDKPMQVQLPDESTVALKPNSQVRYPEQFTKNERDVYLLGEAFFDVTKDPNKPFYVHTDVLTTKVLGTSFTVQANQGQKVGKVIVSTGRVAVSKQVEGNELPLKTSRLEGDVVLTPNQQVTVSEASSRLVVSLVDEPSLLDPSIKEKFFRYRKTAMAEVFAELEEAYGVDISFDREALKNCYLTASIVDEPLYDKLDLICRTINATYRRVGTQIIIEGSGC